MRKAPLFLRWWNFRKLVLEISRLKLKNIRGFPEAEISLKGKRFSTIAGNNGTGKTTILRAIAMGLCDESGTSALWSELESFIRHGEKEGVIEIDVIDETNNSHSIKTILKDDGTQSVEKEGMENKIFEKIFAVGYGAGTSITGNSSYKEYSSTDSLYSLFNYASPLQNAEICYRRFAEESNSLKGEIDPLLKSILMQDNIEIGTDIKGLFLKKENGRKEYLNSMADGHRVSTSIFLDFISWAGLFLADDEKRNKPNYRY